MTLSNNDGPGPQKESLDERKGEEGRIQSPRKGNKELNHPFLRTYILLLKIAVLCHAKEKES